MNLQQEHQNLKEVFDCLWNDVEACLPHIAIEAPDNPFRRHYFRGLCAFFEAIGYQLRRILIAGGEAGAFTLSAGEVAVLKGVNFAPNDSGKLQERELFHKTVPLLKFTLKCFGEQHGIGEQLQERLGQDGWSKLKDTIGIRNGITHPKEPAELQITMEHLDTAKLAADWFSEVALLLIEKHFEEDTE